MSAMSDIAADIEHRLGYHPSVTADIAQAHEKVRSILAVAIKDALAVATTVAPWSREVSLAVTAIENADQGLHAHIARNQVGAVVPVPAAVPAAPVVMTVSGPAPEPANVAAVDVPAPPVPEAVPTPVAPVNVVADPVPAASSSVPPVPDPVPVVVDPNVAPPSAP